MKEMSSQEWHETVRQGLDEVARRLASGELDGSGRFYTRRTRVRFWLGLAEMSRALRGPPAPRQPARHRRSLQTATMGIGEQSMERMLATPADAEIILKLYQLRTETVMRQARAWVTGEFWPATIEEYVAVASNPKDPHNAWLRQVLTYWDMAAAMVLHGAVSAELFVDSNAEGFFILAKFSHLLAAIREKNPTFMLKTSELLDRFSIAAARYELMLKNVEARHKSMAEAAAGAGH
jgi:hypothetical protein